MTKEKIGKWLPYIAVLVVFAAATLVYFSPVLKGKALYQNDIALYVGAAQEIDAYKDAHSGDDPYWTNSMFCGMPDYMSGAEFKGNILGAVDSVLRFLPRPADYVFLYFLSFFVLLITMRIDWKKAAIGAVMFAFSSYLFIILEAGHNSKAHAIAYLPLVVAGVLMTYRGKYLWGGLLMWVAMGLELFANHVQMTYYMGLGLIILVLIYLYDAIKNKWLPRFLKASGVLLAAVLMAAALNSPRLITSWSYQKHTIRGGSELTENHTNIDNKTSKGLDKDYILSWSYGIGETLNLMIPNLYGGASGTDLGTESRFYKELTQVADPQQAREIAASAPTYWGPQPFTSGPAYVGAIVVFLFVLGLVIVKGPIKWWIAAATLLSFMIAWGKHLPWFADFMIDYFPMYNKFRTPSSALIVSEITMPLLAVLALKQWFGNELPEKLRKNGILISLVLTAGICLLLAAAAGMFFSFSSAADSSYFGQFDALIEALKDDRKSLLVKDAIRSAALILLTAAAMWMVYKNKLRQTAALIAIAVLVVLDLWQVDKRYLNNHHFVDRIEMEQPFRNSVAAVYAPQIQKDTTHFRVWNRAVNTMHDTSTSFYYQSVGGYHAAKIQRYQELWDRYLWQGHPSVVNMLNVKYVLDQDEKGTARALMNPEANSPAWFVSEIIEVPNADAELEALESFDSKTQAIVDRRFDVSMPEQTDSSAVIALKSYEPNRLVYEYESGTDNVAVFSEIYYPDGWNAYVDGIVKPYFRADYVLRAMELPAGRHTIEFRFEPQEVTTGQRISYAMSILLILAVGGGIFYEYRQKKQSANA